MTHRRRAARGLGRRPRALGRRPRAGAALAGRHRRRGDRRAGAPDRATCSASCSEGEAWAVLAHVLDFDDLHMESTSHVSAVCVPAVLATGGDARAYLAGAGRHGPPGHRAGLAALRRGLARDLHGGRSGRGGRRAASRWASAPRRSPRRWRSRCRRPAACSAAFGTAAKSLQVGVAAQAGVRAARLAAAGASADPRALDQWLALVGGDAAAARARRPGRPRRAGGQALPVLLRAAAPDRGAARGSTRADLDPASVARVVVRTPESALAPLIHDDADDRPGGQVQPAVRGRGDAARRPAGDRELHRRGRRPARGAGARWRASRSTRSPGGDWLLAGDVAIELTLADGSTLHAQLDLPPGAPDRPPSTAELAEKVADCAGDLADEVLAVTGPTPARCCARAAAAERDALAIRGRLAAVRSANCIIEGTGGGRPSPRTRSVRA